MTRPPDEGDSPAEDEADIERRVVSMDEVMREATLRRLAELTRRVDRSGGKVEAEAVAAFRWRSVDDELAALVYDSEQDPERLAGVRSVELASRHLTFQSPDLRIEVDVALGRRRDLVCQVVPPGPAHIEVRTRDGVDDVETDEYGTARITSVPPGPVMIRCSVGDQTASTSWIEI